MSTCKYNGPERPRILPGRHEDDCAGDCNGCQPCPWPHCRVCGKDHAEHTCPGCMAEVRENILEIVQRCEALPTEVLHRGIDSEAMNLLGPVADPEALGHMRASANVGRIPTDWVEEADHELHPLLVLGTWMEAYLEAFEHSEPARITVASAASYLDRNLVFASTFVDVPFDDFARNIRECLAHMDRVLHDGEQVETGAPCMTCRVPLRLVRGERDDRWQCPRCKQESTDAQYRFAVQHLHRENADWLTDQEMEIRTGIRAGTVREWARNRDDRDALVGKRRDSGRVVYAVADVERVASEKGMMSA